MNLKMENWLDAADFLEFTYTYWNTAENEKPKAFNVPELGLENLYAYLNSSGLLPALREALREAQRLRGPIDGRGVDVACGSFWTAREVFDATRLEHLTGVDFSRHRVLELGAHMVSAYNIAPQKVTLALGNFYALRIPDGTMNLVLLSQALHHAERPLDLLAEVHRVLSAKGVAVLIGEIPLDQEEVRRKKIRRRIWESLPSTMQDKLPCRRFLRRLGFIPRVASHRVDEILGDHAYIFADYRRLFKASGLRFHYGETRDGHYPYFFLWK